MLDSRTKPRLQRFTLFGEPLQPDFWPSLRSRTPLRDVSFDRAPVVFAALGHAAFAGIAVHRFFFAVQQRVYLRHVGNACQRARHRVHQPGVSVHADGRWFESTCSHHT